MRVVVTPLSLQDSGRMPRRGSGTYIDRVASLEPGATREASLRKALAITASVIDEAYGAVTVLEPTMVTFCCAQGPKKPKTLPCAHL